MEKIYILLKLQHKGLFWSIFIMISGKAKSGGCIINRFTKSGSRNPNGNARLLT